MRCVNSVTGSLRNTYWGGLVWMFYMWKIYFVSSHGTFIFTSQFLSSSARTSRLSGQLDWICDIVHIVHEVSNTFYDVPTSMIQMYIYYNRPRLLIESQQGKFECEARRWLPVCALWTEYMSLLDYRYCCLLLVWGMLWPPYWATISTLVEVHVSEPRNLG